MLVSRAGTVFGLLLLAGGIAQAQRGSVTGTVRFREEPLEGARVEALWQGEPHGQTVTDSAGRYRLRIAPGAYTILVRLPGYIARRVDSVQVEASASLTRDIVMVRAPIALDAVVVTAGRRQESVNDVSSSVAIVDALAIRERIALTALDHAAATSGVDVAVQGLQGRQVVARGFSGSFNGTLLLLTDFRAAALPSPRSNLAYFLSQSGDDLERIELVRGPASALYGPNAGDGVVHFITKSPLDAQGGSLSLTGGARSLFDGAARYSTKFGDRLGIKASGSWFKGRDWPAPPGSATLEPPDPFVERASADVRADLRVSSTATTSLTFGTAKAMSATEYTNIGRFALTNWRSDFAQLRLNDRRLFAQVYWRGNAGGGSGRSLTQALRTRDHSNVVTAQVQHAVDLGTSTLLQYGADVQHTDPQTMGTISGRFEDDDRILEAGAFAQSITRLTSSVQLLAALRGDRHSRLDAAVLSPRLALTYSARSGHTWRASYNRAFGTPNVTQLTSDIVAGGLGPLPFSLRAVGVPKGGFRFSRACGGLCFTSPFSPGASLPIDATPLWPVVVQFMQAGGVDLAGIPAPRSTDVTTSLRSLDLGTGAFRTIAGEVRDLPALKPTITNSIELGYHGLLGSRAILDVSVYGTRRENFLSQNALVTPNVFLNTASLAAYLARFMPAASAGAIAAGIGGVDGNPAATGIPLGTVGTTGRLAGTDLLLAAQSVGEVQLWGADLSLELAPTDRLTLAGSYSFINQGLFARQGLSGAEISTNTPRNKGQASIRYRLPERELAAELRVRSVGKFRMVDGLLVGDVPAFTVADVEVGFAIPRLTRARLTATLQNVADARHAEFFGHPLLGRLFMTRLQYRF